MNDNVVVKFTVHLSEKNKRIQVPGMGIELSKLRHF